MDSTSFQDRSNFRRNQFIGGFNFINAMPDDGNAVRRLCCPCCGFNTDIGKHQELHLHYYSSNHVIARGNTPDPTLLQEPARKLPYPAQPALPAVVARGLPTVQPAQQHQPVQLASDVPAAVAWEDLSNQQLREATGRRGWDWQNINLHGDYARHSDPNFVRRRDNWNRLRIEEYIANSHPDEDEPENIPDDIE
ncbi:hypothetical protein MBANPS3_012179 [Mucor bainieri]